jgi:RNA polymerase sigma-70 factor (ECF subfamily)
MVDDATLDDWFCREVLPLEPSLVRYVRRNWRDPGEVYDLVHDIYALAWNGARKELPRHARAYVFTIARHHLSQHARRGRIVSFELMADPESLAPQRDLLETDRYMNARDQLRRAQAGLDNLPPRCREVVYLRKVEGLTTREAADRLGVGIDAIEQQLTKGMRALTDFMLGGSGRIVRSTTSDEMQDKGR